MAQSNTLGSQSTLTNFNHIVLNQTRCHRSSGCTVTCIKQILFSYVWSITHPPTPLRESYSTKLHYMPQFMWLYSFMHKIKIVCICMYGPLSPQIIQLLNYITCHSSYGYALNKIDSICMLPQSLPSSVLKVVQLPSLPNDQGYSRSQAALIRVRLELEFELKNITRWFESSIIYIYIFFLF